MIKNEYMEEIIASSKKEQFIKKGLINRIALSIVEQCDPLTKSNFQAFGFVENLWNDYTVYASCNNEDGEIYYCYEHALGYGMAMVKEISSHLVANLTMLEFLIHEFEHLKEPYKQQNNETINKLITNCSIDFVRELILDKYMPNILKKYKNISIFEKYLFKKYKNFYMPIWDMCPDEKIAESDAYKMIVDSVGAYHNFDVDNKEDYEEIISSYVASLLTGYRKDEENNFYSVPLHDYLSEIKKIDKHNKLDSSLWNLLDEVEKYTTEERMKYGLPITMEEVKDTKVKYLKKSI